MPIDPAVLASAIARFEARSSRSLLKGASRLFTRGSEPACQHEWSRPRPEGSSSGRRFCVKCRWVTDAPFEAHGIGER